MSKKIVNSIVLGWMKTETDYHGKTKRISENSKVSARTLRGRTEFESKEASGGNKERNEAFS